MPDFERIDRELAAIGRVPEAVQPLLDEYGQRDRSLENVDLVLAALRDGQTPSSSPPEPERPSFLPLGWDADRKSEPGIAALPAVVALERDEVTVTTGVPDEMPAPEPLPEREPEPIEAAPPVAPEAPSNGLAAEGFGEEPSEPAIDTQRSSPPPPAERAPAPEAAAAADPAPTVRGGYTPSESELPEPRPAHRSSRPPRPDLQALLDAELDPREFPSTNPPPARMLRTSLPPTSPLPPLPRMSNPPPEPAAPEGDFELLVDDDDILEIDEDS